MIFTGIDPGKGGAIAVLADDGLVVALDDCPLDIIGDIDCQACSTLFPAGGQVVIEAVHAMSHAGPDGRRIVPASDFQFGVSLGIWLGIAGAKGASPILVSPQKWKNAMLKGMASGKESSVILARQLFPVQLQKLVGPRGGLKDGRAEALLLAEYGRRLWRMGSQNALPGFSKPCVHRRVA